MIAASPKTSGAGMSRETSSRKRSPRFLYLAGPGDVIGTYQHWRDNRDDPTQVAVTDAGQFFDVCRSMSAEAKVISYHKQRNRLKDGPLDIEHRPVPLQDWSGPMFHVGWWLFSMSVCLSAIVGRYDTLILMTGTHLWPYWPAKWFGKRVILTEQCVIWPKQRGRRGLWKLVHWLDRGFLRRGPEAIISMSKDITDQIVELTGSKHSPICHFLPTYRRDSFRSIPPADHNSRPFRVFFAGRIERNKGVFDVLEIAERLRDRKRLDIVFEIAGDGSALSEVRRRIEERSLQEVVVAHGHCEKQKMRVLLAQCHVIILPTSSEMVEGFNKVVAEAVLSHRPWITSHLCPAIRYVHSAGLEVPPEDIDAYLDAVTRLADSSDLYARKVEACKRLAEQFYVADYGWAATLSRCLEGDFSDEKTTIRMSSALSPGGSS